MQEIFLTGTSEAYTESALLYQDTLRFFLNGREEMSNSWNINEWLQTHHIFRSQSKNKISQTLYRRKINTQKRVNKYLNDLQDWGLVGSKKVLGSTGIQTKLYSLTKFGHVIALLIEVDKTSNKKMIYDNLFSVMETYFKDETSYLDQFCLFFLAKCKEENVFAQHVDFYKNAILYGPGFSSGRDFFTKMILLRPPRHLAKIKKIWNDCFSLLSESEKPIFMYILKVYFENILQSLAKDEARFESIRYTNRDKEYWITMEITCQKCNHIIYALVRFENFMEYYFSEPELFSSYCEEKGLNRCSCVQYKIINNSRGKGRMRAGSGFFKFPL